MVKKKSQRVTLDLGESAAQRIARLQEVLDARTLVDVIRQSLKLLEFFVSQVLKGKEFLLRDSATGNVELLTILDLVPEANQDNGLASDRQVS